jgi:hypothetical protein
MSTRSMRFIDLVGYDHRLRYHVDATATGVASLRGAVIRLLSRETDAPMSTVSCLGALATELPAILRR